MTSLKLFVNYWIEITKQSVYIYFWKLFVQYLIQIENQLNIFYISVSFASQFNLQIKQV